MKRKLINLLNGRRKISEKEVDFSMVEQILKEAFAKGIDDFDFRDKSHTSIAKYSERDVPFERTLEIFRTQFQPYCLKGQNETRFSGNYQIYADKIGNQNHYLDLFYEMRLLNESSKGNFKPRRSGLISFETH